MNTPAENFPKLLFPKMVKCAIIFCKKEEKRFGLLSAPQSALIVNTPVGEVEIASSFYNEAETVMRRIKQAEAERRFEQDQIIVNMDLSALLNKLALELDDRFERFAKVIGRRKAFDEMVRALGGDHFCYYWAHEFQPRLFEETGLRWYEGCERFALVELRRLRERKRFPRYKERLFNVIGKVDEAPAVSSGVVENGVYWFPK